MADYVRSVLHCLWISVLLKQIVTANTANFADIATAQREFWETNARFRRDCS